jgi:hypothetical protein
VKQKEDLKGRYFVKDKRLINNWKTIVAKRKIQRECMQKHISLPAQNRRTPSAYTYILDPNNQAMIQSNGFSVVHKCVLRYSNHRVVWNEQLPCNEKRNILWAESQTYNAVYHWTWGRL